MVIEWSCFLNSTQPYVAEVVLSKTNFHPYHLTPTYWSPITYNIYLRRGDESQPPKKCWRKTVQTLLHTKSQHRDAFTPRRCYTQSLWHDTQTLLHTDAFTHRSLYTQTLLHTNISTEKHFYTQTLVQTNIFTQRFFLCALCSVCCIWELCTTESNFSLLAASPQQPIRLLRLGGLSQKYYMANLRNFVVSRW